MAIQDEDVAWVLNHAKNLITLGWNQGTLALDESRKPVFTHEPGAVSFCSLGAIDRSIQEHLHMTWNDISLEPAAPASVNMKNLYGAVKVELLTALGKKEPDADSPGIVSFNDDPTTTQDMVIDVFSKALNNVSNRIKLNV